MRRNDRRGRWLRRAEIICWLLAGLLVLPQLAAVAAREAIAAAVDADWSASRRAAYERLLERHDLPRAVGELQLPAQDRSVPVFAGTGEAALTLGAGHLLDSAPLTGDGNIAIAGHRDGFFRTLRDVEPGDELVLETRAGARTFRVTGTRVVAPEDVWVLDPMPETTLTLITCHPFYFVGSAPNRYVVSARLATGEPARAVAATEISMSE